MAKVPALGAHVARTPAELAGAADIVLSILTDAGAIRATHLGEHGLLGADARTKLLVEMSTVRAQVLRLREG